MGTTLGAKLWGPVIGPPVSMVSFVCSIGNVPLRGRPLERWDLLRRRSLFIFADLIIFPILDIYRKYYGPHRAGFIAGHLLHRDGLSGAHCRLDLQGRFGVAPVLRHVTPKVLVQAGVHWDYTTVLNIIFLSLPAAVLVYRFVRTGGIAMLRMMGGKPEPPDSASAHAHHGMPGTGADVPAD